ncbi:LETM1-related biofilm-associated protein [Lacinutrix neustonica]|uniref:LETM1-related biofilm-associated protein n=1 Tax=Lacinutrix neustonica TaxID=2980107 RepID=A0A9E8MZQ9_9FLAO|nr:LETM1-related biofilm-associated protein [Lacinutrix neustonica]WAC03849.1 LETM1-related biofilm-associated protein [Lacinutrix neustonica]
MLTKNFNKATTSTLLFVDVLAFKRYLNTPNHVNTYAASIETMVVNINYDALSFKNKKLISDKGILKKIKESVAFIKTNRKDFNLFYRRAIETDFSFEEKKYFLDVACLTVWEDLFTSDYEYNFIRSIGTDMNLSEDNISDSLKHMAHFYAENKKLFHLLKPSDPLSNFYFNSSQLASKLIKRNSKRIIKELTQSKELMILLTQATTRELTKKEQTKVQLHLLDIFKTIPSLAIFILPGGAILLPIVIKLIPNLLPSAFDDNKIDKE